MGKIATINEFAGMGEGGIFDLVSFSPSKINGKSILVPKYGCYGQLDNNDTGYSDLGSIQNLAYSRRSTDYFFGINTTGAIFNFNETFNTGGAKERIHQLSSSTSSTPDNFSIADTDIIMTENNNLLYCNRDALGYGILGQCQSTSNSSRIVDEEGRDFTALGMGTNSWNNKVYNLEDGEEYEVTSITTTHHTNDTLNFVAGTSPNDSNDYFIAFTDIGNYNTTPWDFYATTSYPQFGGQAYNSSFRRQIKQFDTDYIVGNGNFLAALSTDETTWNDNFKQLPSKTQFDCMDVNQDRLLVCAQGPSGGKILLWDGYSDGWLSIINVATTPSLCKAYSGGWVVTVGEYLYYTNGYTLTKISKRPHVTSETSGSLSRFGTFNGIEIAHDKIYINCGGSNEFGAKKGIYIYDMESGWTLAPIPHGDDRVSQTSYSSSTNGFIKMIETTPGVETLFFSSTATQTDRVNMLGFVSTNGSIDPSVTFFLDFDKEYNFKKVRVKLQMNVNRSYASVYGNLTLHCAAGDGRKRFQTTFQVGTGSTTTAIKNTSGGSGYSYAEIGEEIIFGMGAVSGFRTYIQSIAGLGTSAETYTVSPELPETPSAGVDGRSNILNMKKMGEVTFDLAKMDRFQEIFMQGITSDKLFLQFYFTSTNNIAPQIEQIDIYAD